jgi:hypothetical protein
MVRPSSALDSKLSLRFRPCYLRGSRWKTSVVNEVTADKEGYNEEVIITLATASGDEVRIVITTVRAIREGDPTHPYPSPQLIMCTVHSHHDIFSYDMFFMCKQCICKQFCYLYRCFSIYMFSSYCIFFLFVFVLNILLLENWAFFRCFYCLT